MGTTKWAFVLAAFVYLKIASAQTWTADNASVGSDGAVSVREQGPGTEETFQWIETFTGELTLMSLSNHRYLRVDFATGRLVADSPGPLPDGKDGVRFDWHESR